MEVEALGDRIRVPVNIVPLPVWVDVNWLAERRGKTLSKGGSAKATDGSKIEVVGTGELQFTFWG